MTNTPAKKPAARPAAARTTTRTAAAKPAAPRAAAKPATKPAAKPAAKPAKPVKVEPAPYIVITGAPGAVFEKKVADALANHYELNGTPSVGHDGKGVVLAQALTHKGKAGKKGKKKK